MKHRAGAADPSDISAYVVAVAVALNTETMRRWDTVTFDALVVLPKQFRYYSGRRILVAWNHHFGWSLGIEGQRIDRILIITGLGVGSHPQPERIGDRTDELIADLLHLECRTPEAFPVPTLVHWIGEDAAAPEPRER